ncbi:MAG TPA: thiamine diphosphokinase [Candidatus Limnocylindrales bacterium]
MSETGSEPSVGPGRRALIVADGDVPTRAALDAAWPGWDRDVDLVVAADGGARHVAGLGLFPDLLVGDFDSLPEAEVERLAAAGVAIHRSAVAKDESDMELAVLAALERGATSLLLLGALGGRVDHALANIGLLAHPALSGRSVELLDATARLVLLEGPGPAGEPARLALPGPVDGIVSLLPLNDGVEGVSTEGLRYPLSDEPLPAGPARGLSNVRESRTAAVVVRRGRLLVIEIRAPEPRIQEGVSS